MSLIPDSAFAREGFDALPAAMPDGSKITVGVRHLTHAQWEHFRVLQGSPLEEVKAKASPWLISEGICDPVTGKPALTIAQAEALNDHAAQSFLALVLRQRGKRREAAEEQKKTSDGEEASKSSGTSSP